MRIDGPLASALYPRRETRGQPTHSTPPPPRDAFNLDGPLLSALESLKRHARSPPASRFIRPSAGKSRPGIEMRASLKLRERRRFATTRLRPVHVSTFPCFFPLRGKPYEETRRNYVIIRPFPYPTLTSRGLRWPGANGEMPLHSALTRILDGRAPCDDFYRSPDGRPVAGNSRFTRRKEAGKRMRGNDRERERG